MLHVYLPYETKAFSTADFNNVRKLGIEQNMRMWRKVDGSVALASYEDMATYCIRHDENEDAWVQI